MKERESYPIPTRDLRLSMRIVSHVASKTFESTKPTLKYYAAEKFGEAIELFLRKK